MVAFNAVKKAVTVSPTIRALPSGVPIAPLINIAVRSPPSAHAHAHHGSAQPRSDTPPRWAGGVSRSSPSGLISKTFMTGEP